MESAVEPFSAPISRKHPARSICAVCGWGEPDNEPARSFDAEIRDRLGPVILFNVLRSLDLPDVLAPLS